ncbi:Superfamily II DNA or RNA helicase, SNF2 family [Algoriphagus locisalis]|uniref:Superfamily II DNA or RNA helicase, SNF2 family n=1 Tax=Algoriphagus locisalis TaxID=305507 RepID=A0A1I7BT40_9BACT|nr:DEAD/DEAH box helicase [Algoriphagus locisalis]SFT90346.1 Superfamily II DNA or RNA helicase, SNF2 family [Algoriphagus locisalis]
MALSRSEARVLGDLLESFDEKIFNRGEKLFEQDHVRFLSLDIPSKTYAFSVQGSGGYPYRVDICLDEALIQYGYDIGSDFESSCDCVYYEENFTCKHVAAAALFLDYNDEVDFRQLSNKRTIFPPKTKKVEAKKKSIFPISLLCTEDELDSVKDRLPENVSPLRYADVRTIELVENGFVYDLNLFGHPTKITCMFDSIHEEVVFTCSDKTSFIEEQGLAWLNFHYSDSKTIDLKLLTVNQRQKAKQAKLADLGLLDEVKDPFSALELKFVDRSIRFVYSGELCGMKDVVTLGKGFREFTADAMPSIDFGHLAHRKDAKELGLYNVAFLLSISSEGQLMKITPFIAKGKKNDPDGFHVRFEELQDADDLRLARSEGLGQMLVEVQRMKALVENRKHDVLHSVFNDFIQLVGKRYPIHRSHGYLYGYEKFHKNHIKEQLDFRYADLEFSLVREKSIFELQGWLIVGEERLNLIEIKDLVISEVFAVWNQDIVLLFEDRNTLALLDFWYAFLPTKFPESKFQEFSEHLIKPLVKVAKFSDETGMINERDAATTSELELYISEVSGLVVFEPKVKYFDNLASNPLLSGTLYDSETNTVFLKNNEAESDFLELLRSLHPTFTKDRSDGYFYLTHHQFSEGNWFLETFDRLKDAGVQVFGLDKLTVKRYSPLTPSISMNVSSNSDWFEINTQIEFGNYSIRLKDIKQAIKADDRYVRLGDGSLGQIPDRWLRKFKKLIHSSESEDETLKLGKIHFNLLDDFESEILNPELERELAEKKNRLRSFEEVREVAVPAAVQAELRNYQKVGLNWLNFLQEYGWGGILADDMGLGKTLQVITMIAQMAEKGKIKVLIVAPTTLLFNWKNELEKFAPSLDYFIHHGDRYDKVEDLKAHTIILTSYGLVVNDLELLKQLEFDLIVADESQAIKNVSSLRYKSIIKLKGKLKLAMTGTPIENGIAELYAHMNFVNPGFFRTFSGFKDQFVKELRNGNPETMEHLRKKIQPFVLRRTKEEVLTELPDKIEEYLYCEMGAAQKKIYEAYRNEYREFLQGKFQEEGANQSKMFVLEGLTKLRQICDSPALISQENGVNSAKIDLLVEHIQEKTGNHKILIFSQFVKMLQLVKSELVSKNISFSYLDGKSSPKDRENSVNQFQQDSSIRVFLISLKAGGTGLNLTAADYVYILDPWWNPAVENQAIDRCYRMGQDKKVVAYRMICKDTVEEKIMEMQKSKLKLAKEVISEGDGFLTGMNGESMLRLFE